MITIRHKGSFKNTEKFLTRAQKMQIRSILEKYGPIGVSALSQATPKDTGLTASSWGYSILLKRNNFYIRWNNTNSNKGVSIALILQYGHGTRGGGYVTGVDYINPAMKPVFEKIVDDLWKEVNNLWATL